VTSAYPVNLATSINLTSTYVVELEYKIDTKLSVNLLK